MGKWKWCTPEMLNASMFTDDGCVVCGVNCEPLASWLAEGNEPEPAEAPADKE